MRNIVNLDTTTNKTKTLTFAQFDEAHFSYENKPPGAKILIKLGLQEMDRKTQVLDKDGQHHTGETS